MIREEMIYDLVEWDVNSIRTDLLENDTNFLVDILIGRGWKPYSQLTDDQLQQEYAEMVTLSYE
jgi:hypothetical protein